MDFAATGLDAFHPAVAAWFRTAFPEPTPAQRAAWPAIQGGRHTLVAAPTGSGKTLTAFMCVIDALVRAGIRQPLSDETVVVYVSPLKALSNDIRLNLEVPLAGIREQLARMGLPDVAIRTGVRTGDTPQSERGRMARRPPHIVVTTPESLYVLLGSESGRRMLATTRSVIVDEIHAVAASKRGSHLALTLERLDALCGRRLVRIGLSATQNPIEEVARFLVGSASVAADGTPDCAIVNIGHARRRDLALEVPPVPLQAVMSNAQWELVYARLAELALEHRTTLVFVNTRRMAERAARHLGERLGKAAVAAHHGSLSKEARLDAEQRLKAGALRVLVATASLELGIDIGDVELVCQIGSPRSVASFLQRVGRSGHQVGGLPKGRLFAQSRDDLVECAALLDCVRRGELDTLRLPRAPLDVLAQQIVAEVGAGEWNEDALYDLLRGAHPYAQLPRADFDAVLRMLAEGFSSRRGPRAGYLHRDAVHGVVRGRRNARMTAVMSGGTIPDTGDYTVLLEPQAISIGNVNEDFAVESLAGDVFQLGNTSYRILRVEAGRVRVEDAQGAPPNIPFWLGEAPGRSDALSIGVSRLRAEVASRLDPPEAAAASTVEHAVAADGTGAGVDATPERAPEPRTDAVAGARRARHARALDWLRADVGLDEVAASQLVDYLARQQAALGEMPTRDTIVLERFFDESGGTQLVIHTPYGSRVNRAWGLALRKRFCRKFNFELQAAATEDAIVLSLSTTHSFPLIEVAHYLHSASALDVLVQALLDAPLFGVRWRWNATTALALPRFSGGRKVAPQLQRMRSEDLLATVFPDQVACAENLVGEREVPDHPLVAQTLDDCLHEAMDAESWLALLRCMESGAVRVVARDLAAPSPFAAEALTAKPYAFLDDAPLEERRTQAVMGRRYADADSADDLGRLDPDAIDAVRREAWPDPRDADEMHEALSTLGLVVDAEAQARPSWPAWLRALATQGRATRLAIAGGAWVAVERLPLLRALHAGAAADPEVVVPAAFDAAEWTPATALLELVRSRLAGQGPTPAARLASTLRVAIGEVELALLALEGEGFVMRGRFSAAAAEAGGDEEWCERHLLARIHRYTIGRLRREIEPVEPRDFMRFLCEWQGVTGDTRVRGADALAGVLALLEGYEAPATTWEAELLPARVVDFSGSWLDELCTSGRVAWARLRGAVAGDLDGSRVGSLRATPLVLLPRPRLAVWSALSAREDDADRALTARAQRVVDHLAVHGASFFDDLLVGTRLLQTELEDALAECVARGRVHCDSFAGLRALLVPPSKRPATSARRGRRQPLFGIADAGRWSLTRRAAAEATGAGESEVAATSGATVDADAVEHVAHTLLRRYGVVSWRLLEREPPWLPPWRSLLRVYHRLEARGDVRGGRFIAGLSGEQFALPEAIGALRSMRNRAPTGELVNLSALDPLNLTGTLVAGPKVPRLPGARVLWCDGIAIAMRAAGAVELLVSMDTDMEQAARSALQREPYRPATPVLASVVRGAGTSATA